MWAALAAAACLALAAVPAAAAVSPLAPTVVSVAPASGAPAGGTQVQITGTGFVGATGVLFGDTPATAFSVQSDGVILATAPADEATGPVDVRVVTASGTSTAGAGDVFTYAGAPTISAIVPAVGPTAGGTAVTILGSGFTGATAVDFGPGRGAKFQVVSDSEIDLTLPADSVAQTSTQCVRGRCRPVVQQTPATSAAAVDVTVTTPVGTAPASAAASFQYLPSPSVTSVSPPVGPAAGGTDVVIAGQGLGGVTSVTFGNTTAAFQVGSDQTVEATAPPGSGTATVTVSWEPRVTAVATNGSTAYALESDGSLWQWGLGAPARPGEAAALTGCGCTDVPAQVPGLAHVVAVAAGADTTYALTADGSVWAWGAGGEGQLGDRARTDRAKPVRVAGLKDVTAIAAGADDGYALEANGTVWAWGSDAFGGLGSMAAWRSACICSARPVRVPHLSAVRALAAGFTTAYALGAGGSVWAWGDGSSGQLGNGTRRNIAPPVRVSALTGVVQIAAGTGDAYALLGDGSVWAWGGDAAGQLGVASPISGSGTCACDPTPQQVPGLPSTVTAVGAGADTGYALDAGGSVWAWGDGAAGQLGSTAASSAVPGPVPGLTGVAAVAAGGGTAYALSPDGSVVGWGDGSDGQLGGTALQGANPAPVGLPFWSDASTPGPSTQFTYVAPPAATGSTA